VRSAMCSNSCSSFSDSRRKFGSQSSLPNEGYSSFLISGSRTAGGTGHSVFASLLVATRCKDHGGSIVVDAPPTGRSLHGLSGLLLY